MVSERADLVPERPILRLFWSLKGAYMRPGRAMLGLRKLIWDLREEGIKARTNARTNICAREVHTYTHTYTHT